MKLQAFHKGAVVRLTDHRKDVEFRKEQYDDYCPEWKRFWDEYVDRNLYIKDIGEHEEDYNGRLNIYIQNLPSYVEPDVPFYSHEIQGDVPQLPEELFHV